MGKSRTLCVEEVFEPSTGRYISAADYFSGKDRETIHEKRRELESARKNGTPLWVCAMCQEPIYIGGGEGKDKRQRHFRHFTFNPNCEYQQKKRLPKETARKIKYNGAKESPLHWEMKHFIAKVLRCDLKVLEDPRIEETFFKKDGGREWRRPDVACDRDDKTLVFEVQISTDFLDVIMGRENFYRSQGVFIFWVFDELRPDQFTTIDIYVGNQRNAFILSKRTKELSEQKGQLVLECHYKEPYLDGQKIKECWKVRDVTLDDLTYDTETMQAYWYPYEEKRKDLEVHSLRKEFEHYWWDVRETLSVEDREFLDIGFEERFTNTWNVPEQSIRSPLAMVFDVLYSLKKGESIRPKQNLLHLTNVTLETRKQFSFRILWAVGTFGYKPEFMNKPSFEKKARKAWDAVKNNQDEVIESLKGEKKREAHHMEDSRYDQLIFGLFPEILSHVSTL